MELLLYLPTPRNPSLTGLLCPFRGPGLEGGRGSSADGGGRAGHAGPAPRRPLSARGRRPRIIYPQSPARAHWAEARVSARVLARYWPRTRAALTHVLPV